MRQLILAALAIVAVLWLMYVITGRGCRPGYWQNSYWNQVSYGCHFWTSP